MSTSKVPSTNSYDHSVLENGCKELHNPEESEYINGHLPFEMFFANKVDWFELRMIVVYWSYRLYNVSTADKVSDTI